MPRHGYAIRRDGRVVGSIPSGTRSPTLGSFIGLGYVAAGTAAPGTPVEIDIRGRLLPARIVARPFYRRVRRGEFCWGFPRAPPPPKSPRGAPGRGGGPPSAPPPPPPMR